MEEATRELKKRGNRKIGILGATITTIPVLMAASMLPDITMTVAFSPCDFVLQGFALVRNIMGHLELARLNYPPEIGG